MTSKRQQQNLDKLGILLVLSDSEQVDSRCWRSCWGSQETIQLARPKKQWLSSDHPASLTLIYIPVANTSCWRFMVRCIRQCKTHFPGDSFCLSQSPFYLKLVTYLFCQDPCWLQLHVSLDSFLQT